MRLFSLLFLILGLSFLVFPSLSSALNGPVEEVILRGLNGEVYATDSQTGTRPVDVPRFAGGTVFNNIRELGFAVINVILFIAGIVAVIAIVYGGALMAFSAGSEDNIATGRKVVQYAIVGLLATFLVYMVIQQLVIVLSQSN